MHSETRQASLGHEILRILILKRIWQCKLQQLLKASLFANQKNHTKMMPEGYPKPYSLSISCFVTVLSSRKILSITHLEHSIEQWHPCCPWGFLPRMVGFWTFPFCSDFRVVETLRWNGENLWDVSNKCVMWVHNSLYFDMTTWNSHGFEIKRPW